MMKSARQMVLTLAVGFSLALPVRAESLADVLAEAYRCSNLLDQNRAVLRATDENVAQAVASLRPVVSFIAEGQYGYSQALSDSGVTVSGEILSSTYSLVAQMTIYDFGRTQLSIEAAKQAVLATREALVGVEQQVLLAAVSAFVDVRLQQAVVTLRQNNVCVISEQLRAAQDRFDVGEVTRTDVAQAQARLAQSDANLVVAQGDLTVAREAFKASVCRYPGTLTAPPAPPRTANSLAEARAIALRTHPSIRQAQRTVAAADLNVARSKADMRPTITGNAQLSVNNDNLQENGAGIKLNQTIYQGGRLSSLVRQAMANRDAANADLQQAGVRVDQNVGNVWSNLDVADASIVATQQQIDAAQIAFDGVREEASLGARTTLDVLNAEQDLLDARNARLIAEASRYTNVYRLLASMGLLTAEHLGLGVPIYDPAAYYNAVRNAPAHSAQGKKLDRIMKSIGGN